MSGSEAASPRNARQIAIDIACADLIPGHQLRVARLDYDPEGILRLRYTITPLLPRDATAHPSPIYCWWEAADDRGTHYVEGGGAFGPSPDGQRTEGVFSLTPLPPPEARELRVVLHMDKDELRGECAFTIDLIRAAATGG